MGVYADAASQWEKAAADPKRTDQSHAKQMARHYRGMASREAANQKATGKK
jgi:hypothetical protein